MKVKQPRKDSIDKEEPMEQMPFIPFNVPTIGPEEIDEVIKTLQSGWLTTGPKTAQFEREFQDYVQAPHALAVNSATSAMHLALAALDIGPGDEVITTPLTFCATVNTILQVGATPVLADVGMDGNIDPLSVAEKVTDRTRAIMPVHLGGLPCDMESIWRLARKQGLYVIEDAAHAVGTCYKGHPIGAGHPETGYRSDAVCFSFYATKNLTTGEGGMVVTHDEKLFNKMKILCLHGISKDAWDRYAEQGNWYYEVVARGFKYNLSDILSAIGIHQLRKLEDFIEVRTRYARLYNEAFGNLPELEIPPDNPVHRHSWHLYALRLNLDMVDIDRDEFIRGLRHRRIGASVHFIPILLHPVYGPLARLSRNHCPRALDLYQRLISLPLYPLMREEQLVSVINAVKEIIHGAATAAACAHGDSTNLKRADQ
jgi:dTDP-4-amino-4,6-dideoxygalactose transaminase